MLKQDQYREAFLKAWNTSDWQQLIVNATELLKINDQDHFVWSKRGVGLQSMGFHLDAILNYDKALSIQPNIESLSNKGACYWDMGNAEKALECLREAIEEDPTEPRTWMTMGNIVKYQGNLDYAIECYRKAAVDDYPDGHMVLGMALLKHGYLEEGWKEYAWRWKSNQLPPRKLKCPKWDNEDLSYKTILVYGEQGLGDMIQFSRYASMLAETFPKARVIVESRPPLKRLFEGLYGIHTVISVGDRLPELDYAISMIDLAALSTPNLSAIKPASYMFRLDQWHINAWAGRLQPLTDKNPKAIKVGICWAGMSRDLQPAARAVDALRSTTLASFAPLAKIPDILWVSLQKGPPASQINDARTIGMMIGDATEDMHDFYETCCAIENCDLVISVDTAVLHAAASIGKPTWLLSRWDGCWRWFGNRPDSPWYPSLRQFEQPAPGDWEGLMNTVAQELERFVKLKLDSGVAV
jgi:tetratricopeptide (TPR) repeat protein